MCGIVGFYVRNIQKDKLTMSRMLDTIAHRGPDDKGIEHTDDLIFGHVRLAIIDIEHGRQPMKSPTGRYTLVFNGEIYNYLELRQQLVVKGYKLKTNSDSEVLLYLYIEYGNKLLDYIVGMFAFAIYDNLEKTIFLARDHFGVKPLYYFLKDGLFVFASEIKAILKYPKIKSEVNYPSLYEYLVFQLVLNQNTLFKNIYKLEPATYLVIKKGKIVEKKEYWKLKYDIDDSISIEDYSAELLSLLESSVSRQMRSDLPVGAYLSGGLDSSIVATLAAKNYDRKLKTFTGAFKGLKEYNEIKYARLVSKALNSEHHIVYPDCKDFLNSFEKIIYHMDEPAAGPGVFPQYMVSKLASRYVKVALGGSGGDEIFGGYSRYLVAYLEQCIKGSIFETQEEGKHIVTLKSIIPNMPVLKQYIPMIKNQFSIGLFDKMDKRYFQLINRAIDLYQTYSRSFLENLDKEYIFNEFSKVFNYPHTKSYFNKMTHYDLKTLLPSLLHVEDRVSMAVSLESRVPLLDKRIAELSAQIPPTKKFFGGKTKYILLQAVKNILPKEIVNRKDKMGFPVPLNEWFSGPLRDYLLGILTSKKARERGIFDSKNVKLAINRIEKFDRNLWGALNIEMWFRTFID